MNRLASGRRYAQALFELAGDAGQVDAWRADLGLACEVAGNAAAARTIDNPARPLAERRALVTGLLHGRVAAQVESLALLLAQRGRFSIMPEVGREYDHLVRASRGIVAATVSSPMPLTPGELAALKTAMERIAGAQVELYPETDPSLIGGVSVMIGDRQIDASVASRLRRLRRELVQGVS
jgi:F-type H+-transporting ATPase subunit delta